MLPSQNSVKQVFAATRFPRQLNRQTGGLGQLFR